MKLTPNQIKYLNSRTRDLNIFLAGDPRKGDINARLEKQWIEILLKLSEKA